MNQDTARHARRIAKLLLLGTLVALVAMWLSIAYFVVGSRRSDMAAQQQLLQRMASSVEEQTHHLFAFIDYFLVTADWWCQEHPDADPRTDPRFMQLVSEFKANTQGLIDIRFVSAKGQLYYLHSPDDQPLADVTDRDYFAAQAVPATRGLFVGKPVLSRVTHRWGLPISYPLHSQPHGLSVIFAAIENRALEGPFDITRTHPDGAILVVNRNGTLLFRSPSSDQIGDQFGNTSLFNEKLPQSPSGFYQVDDSAVDHKQRLVAYRTVADLPLVVVTTSALDDVLRAWRVRALYVVTVGALVSVFGFVLIRRLLQSLRTVAEMSHQLTQQANTDFLTRVANRKSFVERGEKELGRSVRHGYPLTVLMLDIDHFKRINDRYGHAVGDIALKAVSEAAQAQLRAQDLLGRIGGEEFAVLLPDTPTAGATEVAERIRLGIEQMSVATPSTDTFSVTVSIGIAQADALETGLEGLMRRADAALYRAKELGRNRVCLAEPSDQAAASLG